MNECDPWLDDMYDFYNSLRHIIVCIYVLGELQHAIMLMPCGNRTLETTILEIIWIWIAVVYVSSIDIKYVMNLICWKIAIHTYYTFDVQIEYYIDFPFLVIQLQHLIFFPLQMQMQIQYLTSILTDKLIIHKKGDNASILYHIALNSAYLLPVRNFFFENSRETCIILSSYV